MYTLVVFICSFLFQGTEKERGILTWRKAQFGSEVEDEAELNERIATCYDLPVPTNCCRYQLLKRLTSMLVWIWVGYLTCKKIVRSITVKLVKNDQMYL